MGGGAPGKARRPFTTLFHARSVADPDAAEIGAVAVEAALPVAIGRGGIIGDGGADRSGGEAEPKAGTPARTPMMGKCGCGKIGKAWALEAPANDVEATAPATSRAVRLLRTREDFWTREEEVAVIVVAPG